MNESSIIKERLKKKEQEIQSLEEKLRSAKIYAQALHDVLRAVDRTFDESPAEKAMRPGSAVSQVRDVIRSKGKPVHINDLLEALGKNGTREERASLTGQLAAYVRREEIFTRPAPNTFGLIELGHESLADDGEPEPPRGFGREIAADDDDIPF